MEEMDCEEASGLTLIEGGSRVPAEDLAQGDYAYGKRSNTRDIGRGSDPTVASRVHRFQRSGEESQLPSSSGHPTKRAQGDVSLDHYEGRQNVHHHSSLQIDGVKHKVFISHSGAQKDFAEQLCLDLERRGFLCPFFDQRQQCLPQGKDFAPLILEAARHCHVAVIVLSEEFLCSKWPMIELTEFHGAQQAGNPRLSMLPLVYKLSVKDLDERAIQERWIPTWRLLADEDARVNVAKWSDAVRALRKANGRVFGQKGVSEVAYRKDIVESIFSLSPPDLLYGSSQKMVGYSRVCQMMCDRFVRGASGGPSFLGLYGTSGSGKTTLSKALCDRFCGEYLGRVCHVDLGEAQRMGKACHEDMNATLRLRRVQIQRLKRILERLCGLDKEALDRITDVDEGLTELQMHIKREPVFLAIDNVTHDNSSWNEACDLLRAGFHPKSRIVVTSRSLKNISDLVPNIPFCEPMPSLSATEAGELFLRSAAPSKSIFGLTAEERRIVGVCIEQCLFDYAGKGEVATLIGENIGGRYLGYHPMALSALGDFLRRYYSNSHMLRWTGYLNENKDPLWDLWKLPDGIGGVIGLQFHSLSSSEQLLFLDIAIFTRFDDDHPIFTSLLEISTLHEETKPIIERQLQDLERSGLFTLQYGGVCIRMHDIYHKFAEWYVTSHGVKWLKNAQCVFQSPRCTSNGDYVLSDLVRLRMFDVSLASARVLKSKTMQELHNLEVLCLDSCSGLRELNLERLVSLRSLRITKLQKLESVTLSASPSMVESGGIFDALQAVYLKKLQSLVHGPDVRSCTSLNIYWVIDCPSLTNMDGMECPHLKSLMLHGVVGHQLPRLPNVKALPNLECFYFHINCSITLCDVEASRGVRLRDLRKPCMWVVEEVVSYLRTDWMANSMVEGGYSVSLEHDWTYNFFLLMYFWNAQNDEVLTLRDCHGDKYEWR